MPKVSGYMPRYSRFEETATGDLFRYGLDGGPGSAVHLEFESIGAELQSKIRVVARVTRFGIRQAPRTLQVKSIPQPALARLKAETLSVSPDRSLYLRVG
jgi:hypothetical protein